MNKNSFRWRAFVSSFLALTFLLSAVSGILLFLRPEGSLAAWTGWSALGLGKKGWEDLHGVAVFFFILTAPVHLAYNWRSLAAHWRRGQGKSGGRWRGSAAALLMAGLLVAGALAQWLPLRWIIGLRAMFKGGAAVIEAAPPVADAQNKTLREIGLLLAMDDAQVLERARHIGLQVKGVTQTLADVAETNGLSPEKVFLALGGENRGATRNE